MNKTTLKFQHRDSIAEISHWDNQLRTSIHAWAKEHPRVGYCYIELEDYKAYKDSTGILWLDFETEANLSFFLLSWEAPKSIYWQYNGTVEHCKLDQPGFSFTNYTRSFRSNTYTKHER